MMQIEDIFVSVLNMSITASYAIIAVVMLRFLFKRTSRWISCVLWGIASFRLVFPFSLKSALSLFSIIPSSETVTPEILFSEAPKIYNGIPALGNAVNPVISESMAPAVNAGMSPIQLAAFIGSIVWLAGIAVLLVFSIASYIKLKRSIMSATLLRENIYQSENVTSPFLLGLIKPKIYMPYCMSEVQLSHVIRHEGAHLKRRDHLLKPLAFLILMLHWFNPLAWVAYILFSRDIELACDEKVIRDMSADQRKSYSEALLALAMPRLRIPACPLAFGEVSIKDRIKKTLSYKKPAFWVIVVALAACAVAAVCLLTDPAGKVEPDSANASGGTESASALQPGDTDAAESSVAVLEPSDSYNEEQGPERLSINDLLGIIRDNRNNLTWSHFENYEHHDIGSGLYIWQVPIDENYCVLIGGGSPDIDPMYIKLIRLSPEDKVSADNIDLLDDFIDLLDEDADFQGFLMDNFGIELWPHAWSFCPLSSAFFPALAIDIDLRYSSVDISVDTGSLYSQVNGKPQYLSQAHTYHFGETIYWSPLSLDSYESDDALISDVAVSCAIRYFIKNSTGDVIAEGKLIVEQTGYSNDGYGGFDYQIWLAEAQPWLGLEKNPVPDGWDGFVLVLE